MKRGPKAKYPDGGTARINLTVSRRVWDQVSDIAEHKGASISAEVNRMLQDWIIEQTAVPAEIMDEAVENSHRLATGLRNLGEPRMPKTKPFKGDPVTVYDHE